MIRDHIAPDRWRTTFKRPSAIKLRKKVRMMDDLVMAAEIRVFVLERVEAVRASGQDLTDAVFIEFGDVRQRELLEQAFLSKPARWIAGTTFLRPEHGKADTGATQQFGDRACDTLPTFVERASAADPKKHVDSPNCLRWNCDLSGKRKICSPREPLLGFHTERVAVAFAGIIERLCHGRRSHGCSSGLRDAYPPGNRYAGPRRGRPRRTLHKSCTTRRPPPRSTPTSGVARSRGPSGSTACANQPRPVLRRQRPLGGRTPGRLPHTDPHSVQASSAINCLQLKSLARLPAVCETTHLSQLARAGTASTAHLLGLRLWKIRLSGATIA